MSSSKNYNLCPSLREGLRERKLKNIIFRTALLKNISLLSIMLLLNYSTLLYAQSDEDNGSLTKEINVVKPYEPVINDAFKISLTPQLHDSIQATKEFGYMLKPKIGNTSFSPEPIDAVKLKGELLNKLYKCHIRLGMGTYNTPYAEAWIHNLRSTKYSIGAHARHLSSFGTIDNVGYSGYGENNINVYGKKFYKDAVLAADLSYNYHKIHFYGFSTNDTTIDKTDIKQIFNYFEGKARYYSTTNDEKKLSYNAGLKFHYLSDSYQTSENNFIADATFGRTLESWRIEGNAQLYYNHLSSAIDTMGEFTLSLNPQIITKNDKLFFGIGISPCLDADSTAHLHFYPNVNASYKLVGDFVSIYASLKGQLKQNNFKTTSDENPFIVSSPLLMPTNEKLMGTIGSKGLIGLYIPYDVHVSYGTIENMLFYINDTNDIVHNRFNMIYDTVQLLQIHVQAAYQKIEQLKIIAKGDYFHYTLKNELYAWHKPTFTMTLSAEYLLQDKIIAKADIIGMNNFYAKTFDATGNVVPVKLKGIVDINLGLEYRYTERMSAFFTINNLLSTRYQRWYNYPNQRILLLLGASFSF